MIEIENLNYIIRDRKTYFKISDINFRLGEGYMMGLLGKNGAGKSTLLRLLYGSLLADSGKVLFNGEDMYKNIVKFRQKIGYIGDEDIFFTNETVGENARILGELYAGYSYGEFLNYLKLFELGESVNDKKPYELSTGQKKQVYLAFVMARHPSLLLLDEPMSNLDPVFRVEFVDLLQRLIADEKLSVILSTHIIDDIEDISDYIGILDNGILKTFGDRDEVLGDDKTIRMALSNV